MVNLPVSLHSRAMLASLKQGGKKMIVSNKDGKAMLEVAKELGVSKDVVKYHQRKMNSSESFRENGKIYITLAGIEKIKAGLRKDKEFYSVTFESKLMSQIDNLRSNQWHHEWKLEDVIKKLDNLDKKLDMVLEALRSPYKRFSVVHNENCSKHSKAP